MLRHTRPVDSKGRCYGLTDLPPGPDFGAVADMLAQSLPSVSLIVTSPLMRCRLLAQRLAEARDVPMRIDERIIEMDFGTWEGRLWAEIPRDEIEAWAQDFLEGRPHGGETVAMLETRVRAALDDAPGLVEDPDVLWVTHAGVVRAAHAILDHGHAWDTELDFGAWTDLGNHSTGTCRACASQGSAPQQP
ncbi:MAG: alpha-ribazole phosphatase family protein [Henriciella sp.]|uniref:alpha-ribazole phosphatase family protein n=1 Tax=Henriciella sp. TaxID=1968823 RepID=UPI003C73A715